MPAGARTCRHYLHRPGVEGQRCKAACFLGSIGCLEPLSQAVQLTRCVHDTERRHCDLRGVGRRPAGAVEFPGGVQSTRPVGMTATLSRSDL